MQKAEIGTIKMQGTQTVYSCDHLRLLGDAEQEAVSVEDIEFLLAMTTPAGFVAFHKKTGCIIAPADNMAFFDKPAAAFAAADTELTSKANLYSANAARVRAALEKCPKLGVISQ